MAAPIPNFHLDVMLALDHGDADEVIAELARTKRVAEPVPDAWKKWIVTLRNGERNEVEAINEWHAGSVVVYGDGAIEIDGRTGEAIGGVKVHRENIVSITPVETDEQQRCVSSISEAIDDSLRSRA